MKTSTPILSIQHMFYHLKIQALSVVSGNRLNR